MTAPMRIDLITVGERARKDMGDLSSLKSSMSEMGLLHPIGVSSGGDLVFGQRRLEAAKDLGWEEIPVVIIDMANPLLAERDENEERKPFTPSEKVAIGRSVEQKEQSLARIRVSRNLPRVAAKSPAGSDEPAGDLGDSRSKAAAFVGWSGATYQRAKSVVEAAEADPSVQVIVDAMDRGDIPIATAHKEVTRKPGLHPNVITKPIGAQKRTQKTAEARLRAIADQLETYAEALPRMDTREEDLEDVLGAITRNARAVANAAKAMRRNTA